jgi:alpha-N-arabinofuranosidase
MMGAGCGPGNSGTGSGGSGPGAAGTSGSAGSTGSAGSVGTGSAGNVGTGSGGDSGSAGSVGTGSAGTSGSAGTTGRGGNTGTAGSGGTTGTAGRGGATGAAGSTAGRGGGGGSGGTGGGTAGTTGTGGTGNACSGTATGTSGNNLTVNVDTATQVIHKEIYGVLLERLGRGITGGVYVGTSSTHPNTNGMRNDIIDAFKEAGVGAIQWPGGCAANNYNWNPPNPSNDMGTDRFLQFCQLVGAEPYLTGRPNASNAASNLQWLQYVHNNTTHPEWNVKYFKVGNEVWGCGGNKTQATYQADYTANYNMLNAAINGKRPQLVIGTDLIGNNAWLETMLMNIPTQFDGIEIHDYIYFPDTISSTDPSDAQYYDIIHRANRGQIGPRIEQIKGILNRYDPQNRIKIYEGEWGDWLIALNEASDGWMQQITVMDAISSAEHLHLFMQHADRIKMAGMAQPINVIHSMINTRASDGVMVKTPVFYLWKMFVPHHSANARWAPNTLQTETVRGNNTDIPVISAGTTVDDQGRVNISLANVDLTMSRTVQVTLTSARAGYSVASAQIITGPAKNTYNDFGMAERVNIQPLSASACGVSGKSLRVTLPSKSVVMLVLTPQ